MKTEVHVRRGRAMAMGSCCSCGRHKAFDSTTPETVIEIGLGGNCRTIVRVCEDCAKELIEKLKKV